MGQINMEEVIKQILESTRSTQFQRIEQARGYAQSAINDLFEVFRNVDDQFFAAYNFARQVVGTIPGWTFDGPSYTELDKEIKKKRTLYPLRDNYNGYFVCNDGTGRFYFSFALIYHGGELEVGGHAYATEPHHKVIQLETELIGDNCHAIECMKLLREGRSLQFKTTDTNVLNSYERKSDEMTRKFSQCHVIGRIWPEYGKHREHVHGFAKLVSTLEHEELLKWMVGFYAFASVYDPSLPRYTDGSILPLYKKPTQLLLSG